MSVAHVTRELEPVSKLIVCLQTAGEALIVRVHRDTLVAQIVGRTIERALGIAACTSNSVLLAQAILIRGVTPVVRQQCVLIAVVADYAAECCVRVESAVHAYQCLSFGHSVNVISKTVRIVGCKIFVCPQICLICAISEFVLCIVVQCCVPQLVVFCWIVYVIVFRKRL